MKTRTPSSTIRILLEEYRKSGLSKREFSRRKGIPLSRFYNWFKLKKYKEQVFVPVSVACIDENIEIFRENFPEKINLKTLSGISMELPHSISSQWVISLIKGLQ